MSEARPIAPSDDEFADLDPLVEQVQDECPTCGAYVLNEALHRDFHRRQREQFINLDQLARRYVDPPRYG
jgi:hypothetical protein